MIIEFLRGNKINGYFVHINKPKLDNFIELAIKWYMHSFYSSNIKTFSHFLSQILKLIFLKIDETKEQIFSYISLDYYYDQYNRYQIQQYNPHLIQNHQKMTMQNMLLHLHLFCKQKINFLK